MTRDSINKIKSLFLPGARLRQLRFSAREMNRQISAPKIAATPVIAAVNSGASILTGIRALLAPPVKLRPDHIVTLLETGSVHSDLIELSLIPFSPQGALQIPNFLCRQFETPDRVSSVFSGGYCAAVSLEDLVR